MNDFIPIINCDKAEEFLTLQYKNDKGYMIFRFSKENAVKFFSCVKKELSTNKKICILKGVSVLTDKFEIKEKKEFIEPWFETFKEELMYITGKKKRPPKNIFNLDNHMKTLDNDKLQKKLDKEKQPLSEQDKKKTRRKRK